MLTVVCNETRRAIFTSVDTNKTDHHFWYYFA
jgi:hypothetical protein